MPLSDSSNLPTAMATVYGTFSFNETTETTALSITPVYDAAGRTVIYSTYSITLKTVLASEDGLVEDTVRDAVAKLTAPATDFRYLGRGTGDLMINLNRTKDVVWGPKPKVVSLVPIGAGKAVELTWTVEVAIPTCRDAVFAFAAMEFNYKLSFARDRAGYTTRTYSGFVRIPQTRKAPTDRTLSDSADAYLEKIAPAVPRGFRRVSSTWELDESKCRGNFTFVDEQIPPHAPPPGVVEASAEHTFQSNSLAKWTGTISATYELLHDVPATAAVKAFSAFVEDRLFFVSKMRPGAGLPGGDIRPPRGIELVPVSASASEPNYYGRRQVRLSISYFVSGIGFSEVLRSGGLWTTILDRPLPPGARMPSNWVEWATTMRVAWSPRGYANLRFTPGDDALIDLCRYGTPTPPGQGQGSGQETTGQGQQGPFGIIGGSGISGQLTAGIDSLANMLRDLFKQPKQQSSWIHYRNYVALRANTGRIIFESLPKQPIPMSQSQNQNQPDWNVFRDLPNTTGTKVFPPLSEGLGASQSYGGKTVVQQRTRPTLYVTMYGEALRAGFPIPMPEMTSVNGAKPILVGKPIFVQGVIANCFVPVYRAQWQMDYVYTDEGGKPVTAHTIPPNPALA